MPVHASGTSGYIPVYTSGGSGGGTELSVIEYLIQNNITYNGSLNFKGMQITKKPKKTSYYDIMIEKGEKLDENIISFNMKLKKGVINKIKNIYISIFDSYNTKYDIDILPTTTTICTRVTIK